MNVPLRLLFLLMGVFGGILARCLPQSVGKPQAWFLPQNWS
jgi:hypothetical protein